MYLNIINWHHALWILVADMSAHTVLTKTNENNMTTLSRRADVKILMICISKKS